MLTQRCYFNHNWVIFVSAFVSVPFKAKSENQSSAVAWFVSLLKERERERKRSKCESFQGLLRNSVDETLIFLLSRNALKCYTPVLENSKIRKETKKLCIYPRQSLTNNFSVFLTWENYFERYFMIKSHALLPGRWPKSSSVELVQSNMGD